MNDANEKIVLFILQNDLLSRALELEPSERPNAAAIVEALPQ